MRCGERCVDCDMTRDQCRQAYGRDLDVDHTIPFHNFALHREANRIGNLKARCASCHRVAEATRSDVQMLLPFAPLHRRHKGYVRGEAVNTARLNALQVKAIRQRFAAGETITDLAAEHGMDRSGFYMIVTRRTWKRVA